MTLKEIYLLPLLLLLLVSVSRQDRSLRHSRHYGNFDKIYDKIHKLDGLTLRDHDDEEIVAVDKALLHPVTTTRSDIKDDLDEADDDYYVEFDYEDEDEQARGPSVSDPGRSHQLATDEDSVASLEDDDIEGDHSGHQADGTGDNDVKWIYYGTREQLERAKPALKLKQKEINEAVRHNIKMTQEGKCKFPQRRVIPIQDIYPNPSKTYIPHCTFLYKCGDDTGCCKTESLACVAKSQETVELYFYTTVVGSSRKNLEKLSFLNHTECECVQRKNDLMIEDETSIPSLRSGPTFHDVITISEPETEAPISLKRCQCPREYSVFILENGECECNCKNKERSCMNFKRGKEHFSLSDRQCIQHGPCEKPNCEFGEYVLKIGRCPKRNEKFDKIPDHFRTVGNA